MPSMTRCPSAVTSAIHSKIGLPKSRQHVVVGDEVAAMQRYTRRHARMLLAQLGAEVQALLPVGPAGGQLAAERKPAAPGATTERHRVARLGLFGKGEEAAAQIFQTLTQRLVDAVPDDIEEAVRAASFADALRDLVRRGAQIDQGQVIHRQRDGRSLLSLRSFIRATRESAANSIARTGVSESPCIPRLRSPSPLKPTS